jgi:squalene-hopene/tetraprenyl-beta-curcumene cyclase
MVKLLPVFLCVAAWGADWNARGAADYFDGRQKAWFAWKTAEAPGGPCLSCHTGLTYLLARPALDRKLSEAPNSWEIGLINGAKGRVLAEAPKPSIQLSVETVFLSLVYAMEDSRHGWLRPETEQVFEKLWARQGPLGAWGWYSLNLDPWETQVSPFYAASLAALAVGTAPKYAAPAEKLAAMKSYLASHLEEQPLQNRLMLAWASVKMPDLMSKAQREALLKEVWDKQEKDGGWSAETLGAWNKHPDAPLHAGSDAYATAFIAFAAERAGVAHKDKRLARGLAWLESHQDASGYWDAMSLNKKFPADSMEIRFMRDAATAYASMALMDFDPAKR